MRFHTYFNISIYAFVGSACRHFEGQDRCERSESGHSRPARSRCRVEDKLSGNFRRCHGKVIVEFTIRRMVAATVRTYALSSA